MSILSGPGSVPARDLHAGDRVILAPGALPVEVTAARADDALTLIDYTTAHGGSGCCQRGAQEPVQLAPRRA